MGQTPKGENGQYLSPKITYLWPHHRKMVRLAAAGLKPGEIAKITGFTPGQISRILGSPMFQVELQRLEAKGEILAIDIREDIQKMAETAIDVLDETLNMEVDNRFDRKLRLDAAKDILDRAGFRKSAEPQRHVHMHAHKHVHEMSDDELRDDVFDLLKGGEK